MAVHTTKHGYTVAVNERISQLVPAMDEREMIDLAAALLDQAMIPADVQDQIRALLPRGKTVRWK